MFAIEMFLARNSGVQTGEGVTQKGMRLWRIVNADNPGTHRIPWALAPGNHADLSSVEECLPGFSHSFLLTMDRICPTIRT